VNSSSFFSKQILSRNMDCRIIDVTVAESKPLFKSIRNSEILLYPYRTFSRSFSLYDERLKGDVLVLETTFVLAGKGLGKL